MIRTFFLGLVGVFGSATLIGACAQAQTIDYPDPLDGSTVTDGAKEGSTDASAATCEAGCPSGQVCSQGACKANCAANETRCGVVCVDAKLDPKNCGTCGNACGAGFSCNAGACALDCGLTKTACGSSDDAGADAGAVCVDTKTDSLNCGTCGTDCTKLAKPPNGQLGCVAGACAITTCDVGFADCNKQLPDGCEIDTTSDKSNCGKCGTVCSGGTPTCGQGTCIATLCGNNVIDSGERCDTLLNVPAGGQITCRKPATKNECKFDFSTIPQLYCNGSCSWGGAQSCDQADADIYCKLIMGSATSTATSFTLGTAKALGGFSCPNIGTNLGTMPEYGVNVPVWYQGTSILASHGAGQIIASAVCTP